MLEVVKCYFFLTLEYSQLVSTSRPLQFHCLECFEPQCLLAGSFLSIGDQLKHHLREALPDLLVQPCQLHPTSIALYHISLHLFSAEHFIAGTVSCLPKAHFPFCLAHRALILFR